MQDETTADDTTADGASAPRWKPLSAIERRVLGVLIEKAKTTPENYPLSLNAIRVGSNQKSNCSPQMQLSEEDVQEALDTLREQGAVAQIQGDGRVEKYRHLAYDWLGVEKFELSVIGELLLRGDQTVGELRGRAARMDTIADLAELRPLLASLQEKGLLVYLTPRGRGCTVTHTLYQPQQLDKLVPNTVQVRLALAILARRRRSHHRRSHRRQLHRRQLHRRLQLLVTRQH